MNFVKQCHHLVKVLLCLLSTIIAVSCAKAQDKNALKISSGQPVYLILPSQTGLAEETAAKELSYYLTQIVGATCETVREDAAGSLKGTLIYVGPTQFAKKHGSGKSTFADEEWLMQTQGNALILTGGRPRGTLYAAYHFLEDVCGVRWWNAVEETVPHEKVISVPALKERSQPAFYWREISDGGILVPRSRLNADGWRPIDAAYGGGRSYGTPGAIRVFHHYLPSAKYFKDHPDWYTALSNGKVVSDSQLALDNQEMRQEFLKVLREIIRTSRQVAIAKNLPPPDVFDVSQNDGGMQHGVFIGDENSSLQALVEKEGSDSAAILDFVNYLADGIKDEFPDVLIETLAYKGTEKPPKTMRARDNVIIRLANTQSNMLVPVTATQNSTMREYTEKWSKLTKHLRIWDYYRTWDFTDLPLPTVQTYAANLRYFKEHHVEGFYIELQDAIRTDMRDMKFWVLSKLMEDPNQDGTALIREFTDKFYGAAGLYVRQYLDALQTAAAQNKTIIGLSLPGEKSDKGLRRYSYLTMSFLEQAQRIYDKAAAAVANNPVLSQRVGNARRPVDTAILMRYNDLWYDWAKAGHAPEAFPFNRTAIGERFRQTWKEQIELRVNEKKTDADVDRAVDKAVGKSLAGRGYVPLPDRFKDVPLNDLIIYSAFDNHVGGARVIVDNQAPSGIAAQLEIPEALLERYKLPMPWGMHDPSIKKFILDNKINEADIANGGFNWYKLGTVPLSPRAYLYFSWSWILSFDVYNAFDPKNANQQFDVWANIKFSGPTFPHGRAEDKNAILVESVVLVKH